MLLASPAGAQELKQELTLKVTVDDAMLIVQVLGQGQCGPLTVQALNLCKRMDDLLHSIQEQAKAQVR